VEKIAVLRSDIMNRNGFGYLRGLPVHKYDRDTVMRMYWGLASHLGDVVPQNRNGHMIGPGRRLQQAPDPDLGRPIVSLRLLQCGRPLLPAHRHGRRRERPGERHCRA
jgi:hypothetical protein